MNLQTQSAKVLAWKALKYSMDLDIPWERAYQDDTTIPQTSLGHTCMDFTTGLVDTYLYEFTATVKWNPTWMSHIVGGGVSLESSGWMSHSHGMASTLGWEFT